MKFFEWVLEFGFLKTHTSMVQRQQSCDSHSVTTTTITMRHQSIVGTNCGDFTIRGVYTDNVRAHKNKSDSGYTITFTFDNNSGLTGMLLHLVRQTARDVPTYVLRAGLDAMMASVQVPMTHTVVVSRHFSLYDDNDNGTELSPGTYDISEVVEYNPVFSTVVDVIFKNVHVSQEKCGFTRTNGLLHGGVQIEGLPQLEATRWFPDAANNTLYATECVVEGITFAEKNRHHMAK